MKISRILVSEPSFFAPNSPDWNRNGVWPAKWISHPGAASEAAAPVVAAYRCAFSLAQATRFRLHLSADERYDLFLDGEFAGRGPERGDVEHWFFESYDLDLPAGDHVLVARVWTLGEKAPYAQMHLRHGFLACPEPEELQPLLATGFGEWTAQILGGYDWQSPLCAWGTGWNQEIHGDNFSWNHETGGGEGWEKVTVGVAGRRVGAQSEGRKEHFLLPAMLGPMLDEPVKNIAVRHVAEFGARPVAEVPIRAAQSLKGEIEGWQALLDGAQSLPIAPRTKRRVLLDLNDYCCARPRLAVSGGGGARLDITWNEALFDDLQKWSKGNRDEIEGKFFIVDRGGGDNGGDGVGDTFWPDGAQNREFSTLWWQAGRFVQILIETGENPLILELLGFQETRYPLELEGKIEVSDAPINAIVPLCVRAIQMCSHETFMDCPYYEQLMYVGDTRLEVLTTYVMSADSVLPKKALQTFDVSRLLSGLTQSRYPSRVRQIIPPFSLWWVAMVHDFALWRGEADFTRSLLPGVRAVCDHFAALIGEDGLLQAPDGWNFGDWVVATAQQRENGSETAWKNGVPPGGATQNSAFLGFQAALVFRLASEIEEWFGEPEIAALQMRRAQKLADATQTAFWNEERGLFADDGSGQNWSEHTQCLAILGGWLEGDRLRRVTEGLFSAPDLARTTIYFSHYLFEVCRVTGRMDKFFARLQDWNVLVENGLKTTIEMPEPTRSDCHAWGAHPLFHLYATVAGIRPVAPGFSHVEIKPQLGDLTQIEAVLPHPRGEIRVRIGENHREIILPAGVTLAP